MPPTRQILGIRFHAGELSELLRLTAAGGLIVVPSAPVLVDLVRDEAHRIALETSDLAITDSGYMVLLWRLYGGGRLPRISGLRFIRELLATPEFRAPSATFWIMPTAEDAQANLAWLKQAGVPVDPADCYVAPMYPTGSLADPALLARLEARKPQYILINLGGGVQERLGYYLRRNLSAFGTEDRRVRGSEGQKPEPRPSDPPTLRPSAPPPLRPSGSPPAIICTGAAIAFLSGRQTAIPTWADRLMLGWLFRTLSDPSRFFPRYWKALRLAPLLWRYRDRSVAGSKGR
jgi:UDP-N-acetyl-D-mannosaminuronic acid transferase (WecB/TagA/CpsF family)